MLIFKLLLGFQAAIDHFSVNNFVNHFIFDLQFWGLFHPRLDQTNGCTQRTAYF